MNKVSKNIHWHIFERQRSHAATQKQMKSKQYPYEVYVLRKRVNLIQEKTQPSRFTLHALRATFGKIVLGKQGATSFILYIL